MKDNQASMSCFLGSWVVAAFAGALALVLVMVLGGWSFVQGVFVGALVFVVAGILISVIMCRPLPPLEGAKITTPRSAKPAEPATAKTPDPASTVKPSKPLPGQAELAARKGEWKYGDDSKAATPEAAKGSGSKPEMLEAARGDGPDDLKQIKGVGPKLETVLHSMGFYHFDQIAAWGPDEVAWVDENLEGFKGRVSRDDWVAQAKILAEGGSTAFSSKVEKGDVY